MTLVRILQLDKQDAWENSDPGMYDNKLMIRKNGGYRFAFDEDEFFSVPCVRRFLTNDLHFPGFKYEELPEL